MGAFSIRMGMTNERLSATPGYVAGPSGPADANEQHLRTDHLLTNLKGRTVSSAAFTLMSQGVQFVLNFVSIMILARLLTPTDFGLVAMVGTVVAFLRVFKDAGLSTATVQREGISHAQVSNLFWINVAVSSAITLALAAVSPLVAWFYREPELVPITIALALTFFLGGLSVQHAALLNRQMRFKAIAFIQIGALGAGVLAGLGLAWRGYGYWALVGMQLTTPLVTVLLTWSVSRWRPQLPRRGSGTRSLVGFGANLAASGFIYSVARGADGLLIGRFYGADPVGLYSRAGALLNRPMEQLLYPVGSVFVPVLSRVQNQPERYRRTFLRLYDAMALVSFLFTGLLFALAQPVTLVVLGAQWEAAAVIFAGFTLAALGMPLTTAATWLFTSQGRGRDMLLTSAWVSGISLVSFVVGLPFGPVGVALAYSGIGLLVGMPVLYFFAGRQGPVRTPDLWASIWRYLPLWLVVCGVAWLTRLTVAHSAPLTQLLLCVPVALAAGALMIFALPPMRRTAVGLLEVVQELKGRKADGAAA